mmetsp:Transcript_97960/g.165093  ORF Transcript_97960/g.165093 Transcript_97960/m.165093 type:complete len:208 (-) Transcript_97960:2520-3143(-)
MAVRLPGRTLHATAGRPKGVCRARACAAVVTRCPTTTEEFVGNSRTFSRKPRFPSQTVARSATIRSLRRQSLRSREVPAVRTEPRLVLHTPRSQGLWTEARHASNHVVPHPEREGESLLALGLPPPEFRAGTGACSPPSVGLRRAVPFFCEASRGLATRYSAPRNGRRHFALSQAGGMPGRLPVGAVCTSCCEALFSDLTRTCPRPQ